MDALLQRLSKLSDSELRAELKAAGQPCGGIAKTTRKFFEKRLAKHLLAASGNAQQQQQDTPDGGAKNDEQSTFGGNEQKQDGASVESRESKDVKESEKKEEEVKRKFSSDGLFYVVQVPSEEMDMDVPDAPMFKAPVCSARVYENRKEAFDIMKKNKGSRFKVFKTQQEAETFINSHQDLSTPKRVEPVLRIGATNVPVVSESANCFQSPKNQQLVGLRKAIEANDQERFKEIVWNNPRYVISSGDTPTIMKEGPRYNALHVTALGNLATMCRLIIETLEDPQFFALMYPDDTPETRQKRQQVLLDLYLNTPDKGNCETPLHFASKFGNADVVEVLVDNVMCDKTAKNKFGETAEQIACSRAGDDKTKKKIIHLLEDSYYVPVLRSDDNSTDPLIGEPWSPDQTGMQQMNPETRLREQSPVDVNMCTKAYAGPMSPSEADAFHKQLRTPPSAESKRAAAIRRADGDKGLERVARELARSMHVPWAEYWEFLDAYVDLSSRDGLIQLEEYLQGRQHMHSTHKVARGDQFEPTPNVPADSKDEPTPTVSAADDLVTNLMASFDNLTISSSNKDSMDRTETSTANKDDVVPMTTDNNTEDRTSDEVALPPNADVSDLKTGAISQEQTAIDRTDDRSCESDSHGAISTSNQGTHNADKDTKMSTMNALCADEHIDAVSTVVEPMSGNGDGGAGLMETPKSSLRNPGVFSRGCDDDLERPVFLVGTEPTKLDLDVLRAISIAKCLDDYPCIQQWRLQVQAVPEDIRKRWPTPAKYRSRSPAQLATSPSSASPIAPLTTQPRLLRYGSPIHAGSPTRILLGSPHLLRRSRHLSDPGLARQQRRVYATGQGQVGPQPDVPRLRLF